MAIIYTYPVKGTPLAADLLLISDTADGNKSKNATIASLVTSNAIDVVDTVTASGAGITASPNKGDVVIANTGVTSLVAGSNIDISGSTGAVTISTSASNVDGSGTANTIPKWSDSNTLTDSPFTIDTSTDSLDIPAYIRHIGDIDSLFGFSTNDDFIINVNSGTDQIRVRQNSIIISTDSGTKLAAGPTGVTLYSDENGSTTVSKESLLTYDSGIIVKGGTENSFARGGAVRFYNSTDSGFVGIKGPTTMSPNSNYEIILPDAVGVADQVLKLPSTIGSTPYQLAWGDASGITTPISTANGGTGNAISSAAVFNVLIGNGSSGSGSAFGQSGDNETAIQLPVGATARRPTASAANVGLIRYNSTLTKFEGVAEGITDGSPDGTYSWVQFSVS